MRSRLLSRDTWGEDTHKSESERLCTIMQAPTNNSDVSITHNQIMLTFSRGGSKVVALQLNGLTKTLRNNMSDVFTPADFFYFFFPAAAIDLARTRGHIKRIKYWPEWRRSQLESQPDTDIGGTRFAETAHSGKFIASPERWGKKKNTHSQSKNINQLDKKMIFFF